MRLIFAGTPEFAKIALAALIKANETVLAVYTAPDRPAGRGQKLQMSAVKSFALSHELPVYQPTTLRDPNVQQTMADLKPDLMIVAAYGFILPPAMLTLPRFGCINIHASLLPKWRGAAPIQHALLAGDTHTGITIMQMDAGLDTGALLLQKTYAIAPDETSATLFDRLATLGAATLLETLAQFNTLRPIAQPEEQACYAPKIAKIDALVNWQNSAWELDCKIRAFNPWPVAYTHLGDELVRIWQAKPVSMSSTHAEPGTIIALTDQAICVATADGVLALHELQFAGGKRLPVSIILQTKAEKFALGTRL